MLFRADRSSLRLHSSLRPAAAATETQSPIGHRSLQHSRVRILRFVLDACRSFLRLCDEAHFLHPAIAHFRIDMEVKLPPLLLSSPTCALPLPARCVFAAAARASHALSQGCPPRRGRLVWHVSSAHATLTMPSMAASTRDAAVVPAAVGGGVQRRERGGGCGEAEGEQEAEHE